MDTNRQRIARVDKLYRQLGWTRDPSIAEIEARIAQLERELEIAKAKLVQR